MSCADTGYYLCRRFQQRSPVIIVERRNIKPTSSEGKKRSIAHHQKLPKSSASYIQFPQGKKKLPLPPNLILKVTTVEPPARRPPDLGRRGHHEDTCALHLVSKSIPPVIEKNIPTTAWLASLRSRKDVMRKKERKEEN